MGWGHPTCWGLHPPRCPQGKGPTAQGRYPRDAQGERGGSSCLCQVFTPTPLFSYFRPPTPPTPEADAFGQRAAGCGADVKPLPLPCATLSCAIPARAPEGTAPGLG